MSNPNDALTSSSLTRGDEHVLNVVTGELLDLRDTEIGALAQARDELIQTRAQIDDASRLIDSEIARRLDLENQRKTLAGGYGLEVNAPSKAEWDVTRLMEVLTELIGENRLGVGVIERAITQTVTYKPSQRELNKLLDHDNDEVRERIRECRSMVPQRRRVTVTPPQSHPQLQGSNTETT